MDGPVSDQATDLALSTLREIRGLRIRCRGYRLPEPTRQAHVHVNEVRRKGTG